MGLFRSIMLFKGNDIVHFKQLDTALVTLFRMATMEDWTDIMYTNMFGCMHYGYYGSLYCHDEVECSVEEMQQFSFPFS